MKTVLRALKWVIGALVFFLLFAFALNNQEKVQVHLVFGWSGQTPLVLVILLAFAVGLIAGILGMLPHWWKQRRKAEHPARSPAATAPMKAPQTPSSSADFDYGP